jgi:hypothetical protein
MGQAKPIATRTSSPLLIPAYPLSCTVALAATTRIAHCPSDDAFTVSRAAEVVITRQEEFLAMFEGVACGDYARCDKPDPVFFCRPTRFLACLLYSMAHCAQGQNLNKLSEGIEDLNALPAVRSHVFSVMCRTPGNYAAAWSPRPAD